MVILQGVPWGDARFGSAVSWQSAWGLTSSGWFVGRYLMMVFGVGLARNPVGFLVEVSLKMLKMQVFFGPLWSMYLEIYQLLLYLSSFSVRGCIHCALNVMRGNEMPSINAHTHTHIYTYIYLDAWYIAACPDGRTTESNVCFWTIVGPIFSFGLLRFASTLRLGLWVSKPFVGQTMANSPLPSFCASRSSPGDKPFTGGVYLDLLALGGLLLRACDWLLRDGLMRCSWHYIGSFHRGHRHTKSSLYVYTSEREGR